MTDTIVLQWKFEPPDYFEEDEIDLGQDGYSFIIKKGEAEARIAPGCTVRESDLHERLTSRFLAIQALTHNSFKLSKPSKIKLSPEGKVTHCLSGEDIEVLTALSSPDLATYDAQGNPVNDTLQERRKLKRTIAALADVSVNDGLAMSLLQIYEKALKDPDNEFVHLYEIRDALVDGLGNKARQVLGIKKSDWNMFGDITCERPVLQGRHRGRHIANCDTPLREATYEEKEQVRGISFRMIEQYLKYIATNSK